MTDQIIVEREVRTGPLALFSPYVLSRKGLLDVRFLHATRAASTWETIGAIAAERQRRAGIASELIDQLHDAIPSIDDDESRFALLLLKRKVFADKSVSLDTAALTRAALYGPAATKLAAWLDSRDVETRLLGEAQRHFERDSERLQAALCEVLSYDPFLISVELSGRRLATDLLKYRDAASRLNRKTRMQLEEKILRYVCRMALRTTPFGRFVGIGAQPFAGRQDENAAVHHPDIVVRINRGLVDWMLFELSRRAEIRDHLFVKLNDAWFETESGVLHFFVRGRDGSPRGIWGETFVEVRHAPLVRFLQAQLGRQRTTLAQARDTLLAHGSNPQSANKLLDDLLASGLLQLHFGVSGQEEKLFEHVANLLEAINDQVATNSARTMRELAASEAALAATDRVAHTAAYRRLHASIEQFSAVLSLDPPFEFAKTDAFEDVHLRDGSATWRPELVANHADDVAKGYGFYNLFESSRAARIGLRSWLEDVLSGEERPVPLLECYQRFLTLDEQRQSEIFGGRGCAAHHDRLTLRDGVLDRLAARIDRQDEAQTGHLALDEIVAWEDVAQQLPGEPARESFSVLAQFAKEPDGKPWIVVNGIAAGDGAMFSRFCRDGDPDAAEWALLDSLRTHLADRDPRLTDVEAVFSMNVNLHPRISPRDLAYPGALLPAPATSLALRDVVLSLDRSSNRLELRDATTDARIRLHPLNFVFPAATPMLYQFLCALSQKRYYSFDLVERLIARSWHAGRRALRIPRLITGRVIVARAVWIVEPEPLLCALEKFRDEPVAGMSAVHEQLCALGLPLETFYKCLPRGSSQRSGRWSEATKRWAEEARSGARRNQYLDFRNPVLLNALLRDLRRNPDTLLVLEECLPATHDLEASHGLISAEEFVFEMDSLGLAN